MGLAQIIAPIKSRQFSVYDLEWYPARRKKGDRSEQLLELRLIGVYDGDRYRSFTSVEAFLDHELRGKNHRRWYYAHAGGSFDLTFILEEITKRGGQWSAEASFSGSAAVITRVYHGRKMFMFADSYFLLRESLAKIARWIGMEKGGGEYRCPEHAAGKTTACDPACGCGHPPEHKCIFYADINTLRQYNELDCVILWNAISAFEMQLHELGGELQLTLASSAMNLFRRKYLSRDIQTSEHVNACARASYTSSRVEPFWRRCDNAKYYDFNSSFPYAMTHPCPAEFKGARSTLPREGSIYLAKCKVTVPETYLPPLPYRHEGRVYFPTGTWDTWFTGIDLELLQDAGGRIERVEEALTFEPFDDLAQYALDLYAKRGKAGSGTLESIVYKLLLNSLYGKFAETSEKDELKINPRVTGCPHDPEHPNGECVRMLFPNVFIVTNIVDVPHCHVPIATWITAIARRHLYRLLDRCSVKYYCDTDSVITPDTLATSGELGGLKLEYEIREGIFEAPKLYAMRGEDDEWNVKAKGFRRLTYEQFVGLQKGEEVEIERMARIRELYARGATRPVERVIVKGLGEKRADGTRIRTLRDKRCMLPSGDSRPWGVKEIERRV